MIIKRVKKTNLYDVFFGEGWANHSRFLFPDMKVVSGQHRPRQQVAQVFHAIKK